MKAFITTGTESFLEKHVENHPNIHFHFMKAATKTLVFYEHEHENVFVSGQSFDVIVAKGDIQPEGFVVMEHVPVVIESQPLFENGWKIDARTFPQDTASQAIRVLRPHKGNVYIVCMQWNSEEAYEQWKLSDSYVQIQEQIHKPAYFASRPFTHKYEMKEEDEL
ncbi:MAG TPA: antibiotic biosynthesis monooxygenase [Bacillota bacterium]|nr:antibiotic biosynthesis monooxygenase [Bacillota bacterium]